MSTKILYEIKVSDSVSILKCANSQFSSPYFEFKKLPHRTQCSVFVSAKLPVRQNLNICADF
jgi:hypothetical protein